jgi:hypothetical protein
MAKWTVRTHAGDVVYGSFEDLERAWLQNEFSADDVLQEEGETGWRRPTTVPGLAATKRKRRAKWTVRTKDGELVYGNFGEVEQAWLSGLVDPDDELLEEGHTKWRKASSFPVLVNARRHGNQVWGGTQTAWMVISILLGSAALILITNGSYALGGVIAFVVASLMIRVTMQAFKRTKPHG